MTRKVDAVSYAGEIFFPPDNWDSIGLTHALCGIHHARGPSALRWLKPKQIETDADRTILIANMTRLYGGGVTGLRLVPIKPTAVALPKRPVTKGVGA